MSVIQIQLSGMSADDKMLLFGPDGCDHKLNGKWNQNGTTPGFFATEDKPNTLVLLSRVGSGTPAYITESTLNSLVSLGFARVTQGD